MTERPVTVSRSPMLVQLSNCNRMEIGWAAATYPGWVGHLYSPGGFRGPYKFLPYGLDNGRYSCWSRKTPWDADGYFGMLDRAAASGIPPLWALVPDIVADMDGTLREWDKWSTRISREYGWPLAFAAQDGMDPKDVPDNADVVFVGGTTAWKRKTLWDWCEAFPRVHIGRINTEKWLWECYDAGAESCDGTGWFRGDQRQLAGLYQFFSYASAGKRSPQGLLRHA